MEIASTADVAAERGFEPRLEAPKAPVLPLHHSATATPPLARNEAGRQGVPPIATGPGAEGRDRTGTGVAPQQFLRLSRLPIPPLRPWSGRRDSNPRPPPWQGGALPLSHFRTRRPGGADASRPGSRPTPPAIPHYSRGPMLGQATSGARAARVTGAIPGTRLGRGSRPLRRPAIG